MAYEVEMRRDADRYSAMLHAAEYREAALADSEARTAVAVAAIKAIRGMTARDVCNVIEALHCQMERGAIHGDEATAAIEYLMDAHSIAERLAEREQA